MSAIIKLYIKKIKDGSIDITQVPARWRSEVIIELQKFDSQET